MRNVCQSSVDDLELQAHDYRANKSVVLKDRAGKLHMAQVHGVLASPITFYDSYTTVPPANAKVLGVLDVTSKVLTFDAAATRGIVAVCDEKNTGVFTVAFR